MNISITDEKHNTININNEKIICLTISNFILSFLLSLVIDLYNLNPLTAIAIIAGINNIFCKNKLEKIKPKPLEIPKTLIKLDIVYPRQNPLYKTIPNTTGIPITVVPKNHIKQASIILLKMLSLNNCKLSKF